MRLYAAGFNAWNQLQFSTPAKAGNGDCPPDDRDSEPDDVYPFACVLESEKLDAIRPSLTFTAVTTANGQLIAGDVRDPSVCDHGGYSYVEALNGRVVVYDDADIIYQYASVADFCNRNGSGVQCIVFKGPVGIVQMVAYDTGFAALTSTGQVWTWGDSRFPECLCRTVTDERFVEPAVDVPAETSPHPDSVFYANRCDSPAGRPGRVTCLEGLPTGPIVKISAAGYVLAALMSGRDLYAWGGYPGRRPVLEGLTGDPVPIVVDLEDNEGGDEADVDIVDVGMGEAHMIVLMADGTVRAIGSNTNGQLGLDPSQRAAASSWVNVDLPLLKNEYVVGVMAGPKSSFVLVDEKP